MSYSRELAKEIRSAQNTFVYYLSGVNITIIGFMFTQITSADICFSFIFSAIGVLLLVSSVICCFYYISYGMWWYQLVVSKAKISERMPNIKDPKVVKSISNHETEIEKVGRTMNSFFNSSLVVFFLGILCLFIWKVITIL